MMNLLRVLRRHYCMSVTTTAVARGTYDGLRGWMMSLTMIFDRTPARRESCIAKLSLSRIPKGLKACL